MDERIKHYYILLGLGILGAAGIVGLMYFVPRKMIVYI